MLSAIASGVETVSVLDIHSGLGPSGKATLILNCNKEIDERQERSLKKHSSSQLLIDRIGENLYSPRGTLSLWCKHNLPNRSMRYLCVEIGTLNPLALFNALRRENMAHHWALRYSDIDTRSKRALENAFSPSRNDWKYQSTLQALDAMQKTINLDTHSQNTATGTFIGR